MKKRWIILIILVLLIGFGCYNFFVPHGGPRRAVANYKDLLRARGESLELQTLHAVERPGRNAANEFLWFRAAWNSPRDNLYITAKHMLAPGFAVVGHTNISAAQMSTYATNKLRAAQLRELLRGAKLDFNLDYLKGKMLLLPQLATLNATTMCLGDTTMQALHENDLDEATQDICAAVDLMRAWGDEPLLISCLVRLACVRISIGFTWEALQHDGWTDAQLAAMQSDWEQLDIISPLGTVLSGERAFGENAMSKARTAKSYAGLQGGEAPGFGDWIGSLMTDGKKTLREAYDRFPKFWKWKSYWSFDEEHCFLELASAAVDASRKLATNRVFVPIYSSLMLQSSNIADAHRGGLQQYLLITQDMMTDDGYTEHGIYLSTMKKAAQAEAARGLLITAIALKRYHVRNGKWPDSLEQLVPDFLGKTPLDFMDGKPLRYKPVPGGQYRLYSVGLNGKDDGGNPSEPGLPWRPGLNINFTEGLDIVWPQRAAEQEMQDFEARRGTNTNAVPSK